MLDNLTTKLVWASSARVVGYNEHTWTTTTSPISAMAGSSPTNSATTLDANAPSKNIPRADKRKHLERIGHAFRIKDYIIMLWNLLPQSCHRWNGSSLHLLHPAQKFWQQKTSERSSYWCKNRQGAGAMHGILVLPPGEAAGGSSCTRRRQMAGQKTQECICN